MKSQEKGNGGGRAEAGVEKEKDRVSVIIYHCIYLSMELLYFQVDYLKKINLFFGISARLLCRRLIKC